MLPIEALTLRLRDLVGVAIEEHSDRIHINRTLPLNYDENEVPGILINQGSDEPNVAASTLDRLGWVATFDIVFNCAGSSATEADMVSELNAWRLRLHQTLMAVGALGFDWVIDIAPSAVPEVQTDNSSSVVLKEMTTSWQILYHSDRRNPDVSYP